MAFLDDFVTNTRNTLSNISTTITNFVHQDSYGREKVAKYQNQAKNVLSTASAKLSQVKTVVTQANQTAVNQATNAVKRIQANTQKQGNNSANVPVMSSGSDTKSATQATENTIINVYDKLIDTRDTMYANGLVSTVSSYKSGTLASAEGIKGVATFAAPLAADMLLPLDAVNVGQKIATGRISELTKDDWIGAGIDTLATIAGLFSFGTGYVAVKGLKTGVKTVKAVSNAALIGYSAKNMADGVKQVSEYMES